MTEVTLPGSSAELDTTWLSGALRKGPHADLLDSGSDLIGATFVPINTAVNLMGELVRCQLQWSTDKPGLPSSLVAKLPSPSPDNHALCLAMGYYEAEQGFYREFAPNLGMRTPRCWFADGDAESERYVLLLDDLAGNRVVDQADGLDGDLAEGALRALARMHGRWWMAPELERHPWLPAGYGADIHVYGVLMEQAWPDWVQAASEILDDRAIALAERFVRNYTTIVDAAAVLPWTLVHRDFRCDNLFFDGTDPIVIDWAATARGGNLYDLAYFLGGSLTEDTRRSHHDRLVAAYREELARAGGDPFDDATFDEQFRYAALFSLIVPILAGGNVLDRRDEKGRELVATMLLRTFDLLHDVDAADSLPD